MDLRYPTARRQGTSSTCPTKTSERNFVVENSTFHEYVLGIRFLGATLGSGDPAASPITRAQKNGTNR